MVPSGFIFQRKFFNLIILISLINSSYSYLSFRYPYAIKLNNKNIFVIHELGVTICDKTFTESIDRVITFSESEQINTDAALSKVTSVITSSYVICLINNKIYIFNEEGYFLKKSDFKIKKRVDDLKQQINKCNLDNFYKNFRPKCNDKAIGSISSLDFLVETTFNCSPNHYDIMIEDREKLNSYIYKFRSVLGDGDCFYRGFIFSFLENIILTNNIMLMKELLILFHEKINPKNDLIKDKDYLLILHQMNFEIVTSILYILINQMESDI